MIFKTKSEENQHYTIPNNTWVKAKNGRLRYVTSQTSETTFLDDGKQSNEKPSPYCHYKHYTFHKAL